MDHETASASSGRRVIQALVSPLDPISARQFSVLTSNTPYPLTEHLRKAFAPKFVAGGRAVRMGGDSLEWDSFLACVRVVLGLLLLAELDGIGLRGARRRMVGSGGREDAVDFYSDAIKVDIEIEQDASSDAFVLSAQAENNVLGSDHAMTERESLSER